MCVNHCACWALSLPRTHAGATQGSGQVADVTSNLEPASTVRSWPAPGVPAGTLSRPSRCRADGQFPTETNGKGRPL
jgi:hypothetical protein